MRFHTFGRIEKKRIMLIHGMGTTWEMSFSSLIPVLEKDHYVIAVSLDGYDPEENSIFDSFEKQAEKIFDFIAKEHNGKMDIIYAASMGGAILLHLLSRKSVQVDTAIIDGLYASHYGTFAKLASNLMTSLTYKTMSGTSSLLMKAMGIDNLDELKKKMYVDAARETIYHSLYSTYTFTIPEHLSDEINFWYGSKETFPPKLVSKLKKVNQHVKVRVFTDCGHGALLNQPERLADEIKTLQA